MLAWSAMLPNSKLYLTCIFPLPRPEWKYFLTHRLSDSNPEVLDKDMLDSFQVNTLGLLHSIQAFLPLIRKGSVKKVANISSGMADINAINDAEIEVAGPYSASKAAANIVIAKYNAALKGEGILFLSISPGYVATERNFEAAESKWTSLRRMLGADGVCR
jgi:NAD(P)-dependent dehydrogenase (short-subunit alcohol dehydrogenase family)